jgi:methyl-accepting chemotaxis protein
MKDLATLVDKEVASGEEAGAIAQSGYDKALYTFCGLLLLALIATGFIALVISRSLSRQLGGEPAYAVEIMNEIASGNLKADVKLKDNDTQSLLATIKFMNSKLADIIDGIIHGSEAISLAASEISQGNNDLSQRTEEQAASLVQTSSNMQQITENVKATPTTPAGPANWRAKRHRPP